MSAHDEKNRPPSHVAEPPAPGGARVPAPPPQVVPEPEPEEVPELLGERSDYPVPRADE